MTESTLAGKNTATLGTRGAYIFYMIVFITGVIIASRLTPSSNGVGTHEQLGFPACGFLTLTGWPCPSCGLTTSITHLVHGNFTQSAIVQPFGVFLFVALASLFVYSLWAFVVGRPLSALTESVAFEKAQFILLAVLLVSWVYNILRFKSVL
jgi:hypothetical protein